MVWVNRILPLWLSRIQVFHNTCGIDYRVGAWHPRLEITKTADRHRWGLFDRTRHTGACGLTNRHNPVLVVDWISATYTICLKKRPDPLSYQEHKNKTVTRLLHIRYYVFTFPYVL